MSATQYRLTAAAAALGLAVALGGCARTPETPETGLAEAACNQDRGTPQAPEEIRKLSNPLAITPETIAAGRRLYEERANPVACAQCHGTEGTGNGPLARHLEPAPSNFTCDFYRDVPDGQLFWITREGSSFMGDEPGLADVERPGRRDRATAMRAHRYYLSEQETWQVVAYLRTFHADQDD